MGKSVGKTWTDRKVTLFILGLPNSGKTSVLHKLNLGETYNVTQQQGTKRYGPQRMQLVSNKHVEVISFNQFVSRVHSPNKIYERYEKRDVVLVIIDSSYRDIDENGLTQLRFLNRLGFYNSLVAVVANKQDVTGAMTVEEIYRIISEKELMERAQNDTWKVFPVISETGEGLADVQTWIASELRKKRVLNVLFGAEDNKLRPERESRNPFYRLVNITKSLFLKI